MGRPAWFLAATLPTRIPRCARCERPTVEKANRIAEVLKEGVREDESDWIVAYRHRSCDRAPDEVPLSVADTNAIESFIDDDGARYMVTQVVYVEVTKMTPAYWRVMGIPAC